MRGFKLISIVALALWALSISIATWWSYNSIHFDQVFQERISEVKVLPGENRLFIVGSSGLFKGISAEAIASATGYSAKNLATGGLGGKIETAISLIAPHIHKGDVFIIGDRKYRDERLETSYFSFIPNLRVLFTSVPPLMRSEYGDFQARSASDLTTNFAISKYKATPSYGPENIEIMKRQANIVKQSGGCPVLVFVPILVQMHEKEAFETATKRLLSLADLEGLSSNLILLTSVETDRNLFQDMSHLSLEGRTRWSSEIIRELLSRNLCDVRVPVRIRSGI